MTSSRVIRGTKAKIFLYVCAIIVITGLIACYNSTLAQLDEVKKSNDLCHQQQENLSTQLQVISEYKQKLEKSLKNEKAEHLQSKNSFESKINEEKNRSQKQTSDALMKYNTLQQHYNLLQTQFDDFKEESSKTQKSYLDQINSLQSQLKEVNEELKKIKATKESLKTQLAEIEIENIQLNKALIKTGNNESQKEIKRYSDEYHELAEKFYALKQKCGELVDENSQPHEGKEDNQPSEKAVLNLPAFKQAENPSSSTRAVPKASSSQGVLNGAKPLLIPNVTPESAKKEANLKPPQGVVEPPENRENQNEQPQVQFKNKADKVDDPEKDNVAQEVFDAPLNNIAGLDFDEGVRHGNIEQKRDVLDNKKQEEAEYKDLQHEEEGDDDLDDYGDRHARGEEIPVRN